MQTVQPSATRQMLRLFGLVKRLLRLRVEVFKAEVQDRYRLLIWGVSLAALALVLGLLSIVFALMALAEALQHVAALTSLQANCVMAAGILLIGLMLGLWARRCLRRAVTFARGSTAPVQKP